MTLRFKQSNVKLKTIRYMELTQEEKDTIVYSLERNIRSLKSIIARAKREGKPTGTYEYVLRKLRNTIDKFE